MLGTKIFDRLVAHYDWKAFLAIVSPAVLYDKLAQVFESLKESATRTIHTKQRNLDKKWTSSDIIATIKENDFFYAEYKCAPNC